MAQLQGDDADESYILSFPSEPPDIRDLFSSYEYESPLYESEHCRDKLITEKCPEAEKLSIEPNESSNGSDIMGSETGKILRVHCEENAGSHLDDTQESNSVFLGSFFHHRIKEESRYVDESLDLSDLVPLRAPKERQIIDDNKRVSKEEHIQENFRYEQMQENFSSGGKRSSSYENIEPLSADKDGFISTRVEEKFCRIPILKNCKKSVKRSLENMELKLSENGGNSNDTRKALSATNKNRRIPLIDKTNLSLDTEFAHLGSWECPRNHKPYSGPPLKQLRLEQWVRRV